MPSLHWICAAVMFLILGYFCFGFYTRAHAKKHKEAQARAAIYATCGIVILGALLTIAVGEVVDLKKSLPSYVFYGEAVALFAFGASWLTASRVLPLLTSADERFSPLRTNNPL